MSTDTDQSKTVDQRSQDLLERTARLLGTDFLTNKGISSQVLEQALEQVVDVAAATQIAQGKKVLLAIVASSKELQESKEEFEQVVEEKEKELGKMLELAEKLTKGETLSTAEKAILKSYLSVTEDEIKEAMNAAREQRLCLKKE